MTRWYYQKKELRSTPSSVAGLDPGIEARYRREGARFIMELGTSMNLSLSTTLASAVVFFHRFYMCHSFQDFPRYPAACACLFLAGKVEETPKKCKDMIESAKKLVPEPRFSKQFGADDRIRFEEVMTLERILLQTIKFDLQLEHPYKYLLKYANCLKGEKSRLEKMVQMAWNFVNDSLCTTLCLQWEPEIIAIALMYLACKLSKFEVLDWSGRESDHLRWWDMFVQDMTIEVLEDICHQVLDFYSQAQQSNPAPGEKSEPPSANRSMQNSPVPTRAPLAQQQMSAQPSPASQAPPKPSALLQPPPPPTYQQQAAGFFLAHVLHQQQHQQGITGPVPPPPSAAAYPSTSAPPPNYYPHQPHHHHPPPPQPPPQPMVGHPHQMIPQPYPGHPSFQHQPPHPQMHQPPPPLPNHPPPPLPRMGGNHNPSSQPPLPN